MMTKIRRREISIETHEFTIIRGLDGQQTAFCDGCQKSVPGLLAAQVLGFLPHLDIPASIARGELHMIDDTLICANSLNSKRIFPK